ncbi:hypothetical protein BGX38DRAFT_1266706 [Terfezia claveryi]|nr:hypothetical protein BGX38DRAFT_1266706 [Terfezia claveryi]
MHALKDEAKKAGVGSSGVILQHSLATEGAGNTYPKQLTQAVIMLNYVTHTLGWKPSQIIFIGESSGSNLMFSTLLHVIHPCPHVTQQVKLSEPLFMIIALSPWVMLNYKTTTEPAYNTDYIGHSDHNKFVASWLPPRDDIDVRWGNFEDTPKEWWGTEEMMYSDIVKFEEIVLEGKKDDPEGAEYEFELKTEIGVHCEPSVSLGTSLDDIPQWEMVKKWFNKRIAQ